MSRGLGVGYELNRRVNHMLLDMRRAKRCGARTRSGKPCQSPAMANGRCYMHGGPSPGAPKGNQHAFKHGHYSAEAIARRRQISALLRTMRPLVNATNEGESGLMLTFVSETRANSHSQTLLAA